MNQPLDELYFTWLYGQVGSVRDANPSRTYWELFKKLFTTEFIWIVPNDDNRAEDGRDLRYKFLEEERITKVDDDWLRYGCSMLELLIALSLRLHFEADETPQYWFWLMIRNVGLDRFNDSQQDFDQEVGDILERIIWRTYLPDGYGGLFPLITPHEDQRQVELWYQFCAYLLERRY